MAISLFLFGWFKGNAHGTQKLNDYIAKQALERVRIAQGRERVTTQVVTRYVQKAAKTRVVTKVIEKEVVKYAEANPGYCLDPAWRVLHDRAANNLSDSAPGVDGPSGAPKAAEAIQGVTENYGKHHACVDRLDALQEWVKRQQAVR